MKEREAETTEECEMARKKARKIRGDFEKAKAERYRKFQECFESVSQKIDEIYKVFLLLFLFSLESNTVEVYFSLSHEMLVHKLFYGQIV